MDRTLAVTLAVVAMFSVAGCTGLAPSGVNDATPTSSPETAPPGSGTPYPDTTTELPDGPLEPPERPTKLNRTTAASYVRTFEYRFAYNSLWYDDNSDVNVECDVESVEQSADGYRVTVSCYGYSNTRGTAPGTATATDLHADWGDRSLTYYVDEDTTVRFDDSQTASPS